MKVVGYANKLSLHPGENIDFMVSCQNETYHADIVRLIHGDTSQDGPGFKEVFEFAKAKPKHPFSEINMRYPVESDPDHLPSIVCSLSVVVVG